MTATGGTITTNGNYKVHSFTSSGTFTVTGTGTVEYLVVGGGGGGGTVILPGPSEGAILNSLWKTMLLTNLSAA